LTPSASLAGAGFVELVEVLVVVDEPEPVVFGAGGDHKIGGR
jgi:hypothetical protein